MNKRLALKALASVLFVLFAISLANAQNARTWVASFGSDGNTGTGCARLLPCLTFQAALSVTNPFGEIDAVDAGDFGRVTITKSVVIDGNGFAKITGNAGGNAVGVAAGPNDVIILRGLAMTGISGAGVSTFGIQFSAGKALHVEDCQIVGFDFAGIDFEPGAALSELYVSGTAISNQFATGVSAGILLRSTAGTSTARLDSVKVERTNFGVFAANNMKVTATNTSANGNNYGFLANGGGTPAQINLVLCTASNNVVDGVLSEGALSVIRLSLSTVTVNNSFGLRALSGGAILTPTVPNNVVQGNATNGTPTGSFPLT